MKQYGEGSQERRDVATESASGSEQACHRLRFSRSVRVFISSTFLGFESERAMLLTRVLPELRRRALGRQLDVDFVDLRWGITQAQVEQRRAVEICLAEVARCRPYFVGLCGERRGWIPKQEDVSPVVLRQFPWLADCIGQMSITELECVVGCTQPDQEMARVFFAVKEQPHDDSRGKPPATQSRVDTTLDRLINHAAARGSVILRYTDQRAGLNQLIELIWEQIERDFPVADVPNGATRLTRASEWRAQLAIADKFVDTSMAKSAAAALVRRQLGAPTGDHEASLIVAAGIAQRSAESFIASVAVELRRLDSRCLVIERHLASAGKSATSADWLRSICQELLLSAKDIDAWASCALVELNELPNEGLASLLRRCCEVAARSTSAPIMFAISGLESIEQRALFIEALRETVGLAGLTVIIAGHDCPDGLQSRSLKISAQSKVATENGAVCRLASIGRTIPDELLRTIVEHPHSSDADFVDILLSELCVSADHQSLHGRAGELLACSSNAELAMEVWKRAIRSLRFDGLRLFDLLLAAPDGISHEEAVALSGLTGLEVSEFRGAVESLLDTRVDVLRLRDGLSEGLISNLPDAPARMPSIQSSLLDWWDSQPESRRRFHTSSRICKSLKLWDRYLRLLAMPNSAALIHQDSGCVSAYFEECLNAARLASDDCHETSQGASQKLSDNVKACGSHFGVFLTDWMRRTGEGRFFSEGHDEGAVARIALATCVLLENMHANVRRGNHDFVTAFCSGLAPCADVVPAVVRSAVLRGDPAAAWAFAASRSAALIQLDAKDLDTVVSRWLLAIHAAAQ